MSTWQQKRNEFNMRYDVAQTVSGETIRLDRMNQLIKDVSTELSTASARDLSGAGALKQSIAELERTKEAKMADVETARLRKDLLKERDAAIARHALFFMDNPLRRNTIPIMWAISFAFIAVGVLIFKQMIPIQYSGGESIDGYGFVDSIMSFAYDPRVWMGISLAAVIVIIFLVLKIVGVFGGSETKPKQVVA